VKNLEYLPGTIVVRKIDTAPNDPFLPLWMLVRSESAPTGTVWLDMVTGEEVSYDDFEIDYVYFDSATFKTTPFVRES